MRSKTLLPTRNTGGVQKGSIVPGKHPKFLTEKALDIRVQKALQKIRSVL